MPGKPNCNATPEGALLQLLELPALDGLQAGNTTMHILSVLRLMEVLNRQSNRLISYLESGVLMSCPI